MMMELSLYGTRRDHQPVSKASKVSARSSWQNRDWPILFNYVVTAGRSNMTSIHYDPPKEPEVSTLRYPLRSSVRVSYQNTQV